MLISQKKVTAFGKALFDAIKVPSWHSQPVVDGLVETSLRGVDSHGIRLFPHYVRAVMVNRIKRQPRFVFEKKSLSVGIFDADHGFGITAGAAAMDHAVKLARLTGVGAVAVKHSTHFGAASIFGLRAARQNMIGMAFTDVDSLVFPYGGKKTYFGTNPICFTAPVEGEEPFCLDMASSRVPLNKILAYREANKPLEQDWALDASGNPTIDAKKAVSPAPLGDYKGYGLAMVISILSSVLVGAPFGPHIHPMYPLNKKHRDLGHFFLAIDIKKFRPITDFARDLKRMLHELRIIPPVSGFQAVMVSGDPEKKQYALRFKSGIPVPHQDIDVFRQIAQEVNINISQYFTI